MGVLLVPAPCWVCHCQVFRLFQIDPLRKLLAFLLNFRPTIHSRLVRDAASSINYRQTQRARSPSCFGDCNRKGREKTALPEL